MNLNLHEHVAIWVNCTKREGRSTNLSKITPRGTLYYNYINKWVFNYSLYTQI